MKFKNGSKAGTRSRLSFSIAKFDSLDFMNFMLSSLLTLRNIRRSGGFIRCTDFGIWSCTCHHEQVASFPRSRLRIRDHQRHIASRYLGLGALRELAVRDNGLRAV
jgi:hypothetical protein